MLVMIWKNTKVIADNTKIEKSDKKVKEPKEKGNKEN